MSCNATSTPFTSETGFHQSNGPPFSDTSDNSSVLEAGPDTKSRAGGASAERVSKPKPTQTPLPTTSKRLLESESSDDSTTSAIATSSKCGRKKQKEAEKLPTENHLKIRAVVDAGSAWELDLERVHGLTDEEACIVMSIVARYTNEGTFPTPKDGDSRFMEFARQGWKYMQDLKALQKEYPECDDQTCIDGQWKML